MNRTVTIELHQVDLLGRGVLRNLSSFLNLLLLNLIVLLLSFSTRWFSFEVGQTGVIRSQIVLARLVLKVCQPQWLLSLIEIHTLHVVVLGLVQVTHSIVVVRLRSSGGSLTHVQVLWLLGRIALRQIV